MLLDLTVADRWKHSDADVSVTAASVAVAADAEVTVGVDGGVAGQHSSPDTMALSWLKSILADIAGPVAPIITVTTSCCCCSPSSP